MLDVVRSHGFIPEEIYIENGKTVYDCSLEKVILYDIFCQARTSASLNYNDFSKCYNSITHTIASLVFQVFGIPLEAVESMLKEIEEIQYFLRTAYGDTNVFFLAVQLSSSS